MLRARGPRGGRPSPARAPASPRARPAASDAGSDRDAGARRAIGIGKRPRDSAFGRLACEGEGVVPALRAPWGTRASLCFGQERRCAAPRRATSARPSTPRADRARPAAAGRRRGASDSGAPRRARRAGRASLGPRLHAVGHRRVWRVVAEGTDAGSDAGSGRSTVQIPGSDAVRHGLLASRPAFPTSGRAARLGAFCTPERRRPARPGGARRRRRVQEAPRLARPKIGVLCLFRRPAAGTATRRIGSDRARRRAARGRGGGRTLPLAPPHAGSPLPLPKKSGTRRRLSARRLARGVARRVGRRAQGKRRSSTSAARPGGPSPRSGGRVESGRSSEVPRRGGGRRGEYVRQGGAGRLHLPAAAASRLAARPPGPPGRAVRRGAPRETVPHTDIECEGKGAALLCRATCREGFEGGSQRYRCVPTAVTGPAKSPQRGAWAAEFSRPCGAAPPATTTMDLRLQPGRSVVQALDRLRLAPLLPRKGGPRSPRARLPDDEARSAMHDFLAGFHRERSFVFECAADGLWCAARLAFGLVRGKSRARRPACPAPAAQWRNHDVSRLLRRERKGGVCRCRCEPARHPTRPQRRRRPVASGDPGWASSGRRGDARGGAVSRPSPSALLNCGRVVDCGSLRVGPDGAADALGQDPPARPLRPAQTCAKTTEGSVCTASCPPTHVGKSVDYICDRWQGRWLPLPAGGLHGWARSIG